MLAEARRTWLEVDAEKCVNCHQCIAACPVKYCNDGSGDHIRLDHNLCILCGNCVTACSHGARRPLDDLGNTLDALRRGEKLCAIVAPAVASEFGGDALRVNGWLAHLGVRAIFDVSFGADLTARSYAAHIRTQAPQCVIAQPCPVIVNYIQLYRPELIRHLAPVDSPMGHTVKMIRAHYPELADHRILIVSPCMAKAREFADQGVDALSIMVASIKQHLESTGVDLHAFPERPFDGPAPERGVCFPMPGGLLETLERELPGVKAHARQIEGTRVYPYLDSLSTTIAAGNAPLLIDCLNCEAGCIGGTGTTHSRNADIDGLERAIRRRRIATTAHYGAAGADGASTADSDGSVELRATIDAHWERARYTRTYVDRSAVVRGALSEPDEAQRQKILQAMRKHSESDIRNCAACGYDTCEGMIRAIHNGLNRPDNCHLFLQKKAAEQLLDELLVGVMLIDPGTHTIVRVNARAAQMIGLPPDEITGRVCHHFVCPEAAGKCPITDLGAALDEAERVLLTAGGNRLPVLKSVRRVKICETELLLESLVDVSEQSRLRTRSEAAIRALEGNRAELLAMMQAAEAARAAATAERERLENVIQGTRVGTWEWNVQTGATQFNEIWAALCGYTLSELEPTSVDTWTALVHPEDLLRSHELLARHFAGETDYYDCECRIRHKAGHWIWVQDRGKLISRTADGKPLLMFGTHADITARKEAEEGLKALNNALIGREERVAQMKQEVNFLLRASSMPPRYTALDQSETQPTERDAAPVENENSAPTDIALGELIDARSLETLLRAFCQYSGVASAVVDLHGVVLASANWKRICTDFHRVHDETRRRCVESDTNLAARLRKGETHVLYQCCNGLTDAASPIVIGGKHVANAFVGQFLLQPPDVEMFRQQARAYGFDEAEYLTSLAEVPLVPAEKLPAILDSLTNLAAMAARMGVDRLHAREAARSLEGSRSNLMSQRRAAISLFEDAERARAKLAQLNTQLEEQTARANEMAARAELASAAKSEFLANMSHEIRTPMTAILGFTEAAMEGCPGQCGFGAGEHRECLETIARNGQHLLQVINDILDLSKIEAGKLAVERIACSPRQIVAEVESLMRSRSDARGLELHVCCEDTVPVTIQSDPTRLRQVLINLVGNAVKFTNCGSVQLTAGLTRLPNRQPALRFDVKDTGVGLTPDQADQLFKPFSQADSSTTRTFGGTGLGLVISKRLAEALGGDVELAASIPGVGSHFRLTVATGPLEIVQPPAQAPQTSRELAGVPREMPAQPTPLQCRILVAEDGPDNQRLISLVLRKAGAEVTVVENGQLAVEAAMSNAQRNLRGGDQPAFDVILMDMQMPVMDGYTATTLLRRGGYAGPIIALTAHAMASDRQKCLDAGCDDYATKPIDRRELIEMIRRHNAKTPNPSHEESPRSANP